MNALQRNDWPETDAGVRAAFEFSKPHGAENLLPGEVSSLYLFNCQKYYTYMHILKQS